MRRRKKGTGKKRERKSRKEMREKIKIMIFIGMCLFFLIGGIYYLSTSTYDPPKFYA